MNILFTYNPLKNPTGAFLDGVPLADVDKATWDALPEHVQASVLVCPFYARVTAVVDAPALNIPGIGVEIVVALANAGFTTVAEIAAATDEQLLNISGIGPARLVNVRAALAQLEND
ncbi:MAG: helix-hairpin-helix domain-containing protein [Anaerolinea sp.]|nr:helix-hairpin-helix domain-containing protein [Anaerolinea sp.]